MESTNHATRRESIKTSAAAGTDAAFAPVKPESARGAAEVDWDKLWKEYQKLSRKNYPVT